MGTMFYHRTRYLTDRMPAMCLCLLASCWPLHKTLYGIRHKPGMPDCPSDNDDLGANCAAWYQALNAVTTVQQMREESEE